MDLGEEQLEEQIQARKAFEHLRAAIESVRTIDTWDQKKLQRIISELYLRYGQVFKIGFHDGEYCTIKNIVRAVESFTSSCEEEGDVSHDD